MGFRTLALSVADRPAVPLFAIDHQSPPGLLEEKLMRRSISSLFSSLPRQLKCVEIGLCLGLLASSCGASSTAGWFVGEGVDLKLQGFGTLAVVRTDDDSAQYVRDLSQPAGAGSSWTGKVDSLLGVQANLHFTPQTEAVLQAVSRYHHDGSHVPELAWAFLRHDFTPDFSLRAGRLGTELYMLGDSRLVGYSNLTMRPPPDFYGSLVFSYMDGIDVSTTLPLANGLLSGKLFAGRSPEKAPFGFGIDWDLNGSNISGGYLDYLNGAWQFRLSHAQVRFKHETPIDEWLARGGIAIPPYLALVPGMAMAGQSAHFSSIGLVYDEGPLNFQLMLNRIRHDSPAYEDSGAGYLLAAYRVGTLTPYLGISRSFTTREPLPSSPLPGIDALTASMVAQSHVDQYTITLGGRWDVRKNLALKAQIDWIRGEPSSLFLFKNVDPVNWDGNTTVFGLALDFVF